MHVFNASSDMGGLGWVEMELCHHCAWSHEIIIQGCNDVQLHQAIVYWYAAKYKCVSDAQYDMCVQIESHTFSKYFPMYWINILLSDYN